MTLAAEELERNRVYMSTSMPENTEEVQVDGVLGYVFSFENEYGDPYTILLKYESGLYFGILVSPEVVATDESRFEVHFTVDKSNGEVRICLDRWTVGSRTLPEAYVQSVLWANAWSHYLRTGTIAFSYVNR